MLQDMLTNHVYSAPEAELIEVRFEERFLDGTNGNGLPGGHGVPFGAPRRGTSYYDDFDEE